VQPAARLRLVGGDSGLAGDRSAGAGRRLADASRVRSLLHAAGRVRRHSGWGRAGGALGKRDRLRRPLSSMPGSRCTGRRMPPAPPTPRDDGDDPGRHMDRSRRAVTARAPVVSFQTAEDSVGSRCAPSKPDLRRLPPGDRLRAAGQAGPRSRCRRSTRQGRELDSWKAQSLLGKACRRRRHPRSEPNARLSASLAKAWRVVRCAVPRADRRPSVSRRPRAPN
jgi:hypothetical protein